MIRSGLGAMFNNSNLFDVTAGLFFYFSQGGTGTVINNSGTFRKSGGTVTTEVVPEN